MWGGGGIVLCSSPHCTITPSTALLPSLPPRPPPPPLQASLKSLRDDYEKAQSSLFEVVSRQEVEVGSRQAHSEVVREQEGGGRALAEWLACPSE